MDVKTKINVKNLILIHVNGKMYQQKKKNQIQSNQI